MLLSYEIPKIESICTVHSVSFVFITILTKRPVMYCVAIYDRSICCNLRERVCQSISTGASQKKQVHLILILDILKTQSDGVKTLLKSIVYIRTDQIEK